MDVIFWKRFWMWLEKKLKYVIWFRVFRLCIFWEVVWGLGLVFWYFIIYKRNIWIGFWVLLVYFCCWKFLRLLLNFIMLFWLFISWLKLLMKCFCLIMKCCMIFVLECLNWILLCIWIWIILYLLLWVVWLFVFVFLDRWVEIKF